MVNANLTFEFLYCFDNKFNTQAFSSIISLLDKVDNLIEDRSNAKKKRDFELADKIRSELIDLGIEINDSPEGTTWKVVK